MQWLVPFEAGVEEAVCGHGERGFDRLDPWLFVVQQQQGAPAKGHRRAEPEESTRTEIINATTTAEPSFERGSHPNREVERRCRAKGPSSVDRRYL